MDSRYCILLLLIADDNTKTIFNAFYRRVVAAEARGCSGGVDRKRPVHVDLPPIQYIGNNLNIAGISGRYTDFDENSPGLEEVILLDEKGNTCLKAELTMKILFMVEEGYDATRIHMPVETSHYTGICEGEGILAGQVVQGPAVAFSWNVSDAEDTVLLVWTEDADVVYINRIDINITTTLNHRHFRIEENLEQLQLFPSALGAKATIDLSEIRLRHKGEFIFCGGEYTFTQPPSDSYLLVGLISGIAVTMLVGILFYIKGTRKKFLFCTSNT